MGIVAFQATLADRFVNIFQLFYPIGKNHMTVQTDGCRFLMQQVLIFRSVGCMTCEAASGGYRLVFHFSCNNPFMTLLAQCPGGFRPEMCFGFSAMGIVAFQTAFFRHGPVGIGSRFDLMAEEAEIVALARHQESMVQNILILMASCAPSSI